MSKQGSIFDRLTDSSTYHGTHKHRFDGDGHGKGLAGRDSVSKGGSGTSAVYHGGDVNDLSQITRTGLREGAPTKSPRGSKTKPASTNTTEAKPAAKKPAAKGGIFDRLTDPSNYHGTHKHRFDGDGHGKGLAGRDSIAKGGSGSSAAYHGGDVKDLSQITRTGLRDGGQTSPRTKPSPRGGNGPEKAPAKKPAAGSKGGIFDRLTDPSNYHGTHKHRFDGDGHGRGMSGRDSVSKGAGSSAQYHGGDVHDLSQITRQ